MNDSVIVVHYHELWLKGGNRRFFLGKLFRRCANRCRGFRWSELSSRATDSSCV